MVDPATFTHPDFGAVNYTVVVLYLLGMLTIGWRCSRHIGNARAFFIADGQLHHLLVGLSLIGTYLSALTMMALSGVAFGSFDMTWTVQLPCLVLTAFVITRWVLPRYRAEGVLSVYEFLERRIHVSSRLLASSCFIVFAIARMGIVLYLPALAFHIVSGYDLMATILIMGGVITVYTVLGGIAAVIWTDAIQVVLFIIAAIVSVVAILTGMGNADFGEIAAQHHKFRTFDWGLDPAKLTTIWLVLQTIFETIRIYGSQQDMTQRYMVTESTRKANLSVWISILIYIPLGYAFYFIGAALYVYYVANPDPNVTILAEVMNKKDAIYPYFIASQLPVGVAGAVIAAIFAAAMSSIDSLLNSTSAVMVEDFYKRFAAREKSDEHCLKVARGLTLVLGVVVTLAALAFMGGDSPMQVVFNSLMSILTNGVLGLMVLAFLPFRVNRWAALLGFAASYLCLYYLMQRPEQFSFLVRPVVCNPVCVLVALALNPVMKALDGRGRESA